MSLRGILRQWRDEWQLPAAAKAERQRDRAGGLGPDPGPAAAIAACTDWLCAAQDHSKTRDGGAARHYSLASGWAPSYPETSGYIVPTLIDRAKDTGSDALMQRARRMLDWLVSIQFAEGGFQGGTVDATPRVPVTFNTGQILLGLAAGAVSLERERYLGPMRRAARWLAESLDPDGCWRKHATPFAAPGEKTYETHVSWGLFEAARVLPGEGFGEAGLKQVRWALQQQQANGWFAKCCLIDPQRPLTHTIGYALRGVIEAYLFLPNVDLLAAARRTADPLVAALEPDGRLAGRLDAQWRPAVDWVCVTGLSQIAHSCLLLHRITGEARYLDAGMRGNAYVRRTIRLDGPAETRGGVKGSYPVDGDYGTWEYLNWAAKFTIDSNRLELALRQHAG
jgi:hypothetical protein